MFVKSVIKIFFALKEKNKDFFHCCDKINKTAHSFFFNKQFYKSLFLHFRYICMKFACLLWKNVFLVIFFSQKANVISVLFSDNKSKSLLK